jgi:hypothetical protein
LPQRAGRGKVLGMKVGGLVAVWAGLGCGLMASGQTGLTQQEIEAKLQSAPFLIIRGMYGGDRLNFDAQGNLMGQAEKTFFSQSAVIVEQVQLGGSQLEVRGKRAALTFRYKGPFKAQSASEVDLKSIGAAPNEKTQFDVTVVYDPQRPDLLDSALGAVFSVGIDDKLISSAPTYWQWFLQQSLHPVQHAPPSSLQVNSGISHPILRFAPDDLLKRAVKLLDVNGVSVIGLTVDEKGAPQNVHVVRPLGMGADEYAIAEVLQYRFTPAMDHGRPRATEINIEVNFRIY